MATDESTPPPGPRQLSPRARGLLYGVLAVLLLWLLALVVQDRRSAAGIPEPPAGALRLSSG